MSVCDPLQTFAGQMMLPGMGKHLAAGILAAIVLLSACERVAHVTNASVDRSSKVPTLRISISREDVSYMRDHGIAAMIGTGPCGGEEASVWYDTEFTGQDGQVWNYPSDALRADPSPRFTLVGAMQHPKPAVTDDCAYLTSVGYSLQSLVARSLPMQVIRGGS